MVAKKILVTGAGGYLGAHICRNLRQKGFEVTALLRSIPESFNEVFKGIEILLGDITHDGTIEAINSLEVDAIIHTISLDHIASESSDIITVSNVNVMPVLKLLDGASKKGLKKFIFLSTIQVLGKLPSQTIDEAYQGKPENIYGMTHALGEAMVNFYHRRSDTQCVSLRLSNGYGAPVFKENNCWWLVVNDLCRTAFLEKKIVLQSDGSAIRDFIHVDDIVSAVEVLLRSSKTDETLYHVSSGQSFTILEIAHLIKKIYLKKYKTALPIYHSSSIVSESRPTISNGYFLDNQKLASLGFSVQIDIETGITNLFNYLENDYNV